MTGTSPAEIQVVEMRKYVLAAIEKIILEKEPQYYVGEFVSKEGLRYPENVLRLPFTRGKESVDVIVTFIKAKNKEEIEEILRPEEGRSEAGYL